MENKNGETRNFRTFLILDYRTGKFRVIRKLNKMKPSEIAIDLSLNVDVPENVTLKAHGHIALSTAKVNDIVLEELEA
jgi:hypothetical protein